MKNTLLMLSFLFTVSTGFAQEIETMMLSDISSIMNKNPNINPANLHAQLSKNYELSPLDPYLAEKISEVIRMRKNHRADDKLVPIMNLSYDHAIGAMYTLSKAKSFSDFCLDHRDNYDRRIEQLPQLIKDYLDCIARFNLDDIANALKDMNIFWEWHIPPSKTPPTSEKGKLRWQKRVLKHQAREDYYNSRTIIQCRRQYDRYADALWYIKYYSSQCF